jgi:signal transduction histidine kinase/integral membrane sensor domain MASE1/ActR/RegA family two-component response regulator
VKTLSTIEAPDLAGKRRDRPVRGPTHRLAGAAGVLVLAAVYFGAAKLGLALAFQAEQVTAVWPPTGIALAAILLYGSGAWPGIALGAFLANVTAHEPLVTACGIAAGNTLEALAGAWLLRRLGEFRNCLERLSDVLGLVLAAAGSTAVSATIGVTSLCLGGVQPWAASRSLWWLWWLGDATGAVLVTPVLLTWAARQETRFTPRRTAEIVALMGMLILVSVVVFAGGVTPEISRHPLEYGIFPLVVWAALRFGQPETAVVTLLASSIAIWGTVHGFGPFATGTTQENLIQLQAFMAVVAVTALLLAAAITERRHTEASLRHRLAELNTLLEILPSGVWIGNSDCSQISGNPAAYEIMGLPPGINASVTTTQPEMPPGLQIFANGVAVRPEDAPMQQVARSGKALRNIEHELVFPDGTRKTVYASIAPLFGEDGKVSGVIGSYADFTERKQIERVLQEADRRKDEFLAMLAHELRNPLAPLANGLHILRLTGGSGPVADQTRSMMERQLHHLTRLVDDLLDVSRIMRGKAQLNPRQIDLVPLVREAVEDQRPVLEKAGLTVRVQLPQAPVWMSADAVRLVQVIHNLLDNAGKFTDSGGEVIVSVTIEKAPNQAVLSVRDTGVGIEPDLLPRVFDVFMQADRSLARTRGGLGLGLAVVKGLVGLHGGEVRVASAGRGHGAEFTVRLPLDTNPEAVSDLPRPSDSMGRRRILVVEDNRDMAESMRCLLECLEQEVRLAFTGPEGVAAATAWRPDVVLCDLGLPGMSGYEVARALRDHPRTAGIQLIAVTGYGQESDRHQSRTAGFAAHLTKPVNLETLLEVLASAGAVVHVG